MTWFQNMAGRPIAVGQGNGNTVSVPARAYVEIEGNGQDLQRYIKVRWLRKSSRPRRDDQVKIPLIPFSEPSPEEPKPSLEKPKQVIFGSAIKELGKRTRRRKKKENGR